MSSGRRVVESKPFYFSMGLEITKNIYGDRKKNWAG